MAVQETARGASPVWRRGCSARARFAVRALLDKPAVAPEAVLIRWLASVLAVVAVALLGGELRAEAPRGTLLLPPGDRLAGELLDVDAADRLRWRAAGFEGVFEFPLSAVQGVQFPTTGTPPAIEADYTFELASGDVLVGSLVAIDDATVAIDAASLGPVRIKRERLARIERRASAELVFADLAGLDKWQTAGPKADWREDAGQLVVTKPGATMFRDLLIPDSARIEIDLAWETKPSFAVWLGTDAKIPPPLPRFQLDVWDGDLVAVCESSEQADMAVLQSLGDGPGRVSLQVYVDQTRGTMLVATGTGVPLADLSVAMNKQRFWRGGLRLTHRGGGLRLEKLRVYKWNAEPPRAVAADRARVRQIDGGVIEGRVTAFDAEQRAFLVDADDQQQTIPENQVQSILFAPGGERGPRSVRLHMTAGMGASGELLKIDQQRLVLNSSELEEPLYVPVAAIQAITNLRSEPLVETRPEGLRVGRLEMDGGSLHGSLVEGDEASGGCLVWQPRGAVAGSRLSAGISARIIYREPVVPAANSKTNADQPRVRQMVIDQRVLRQLRVARPQSAPDTHAETSKQPVSRGEDCTLHLRSGDTIPCFAASVDEEGVHFKSDFSDAIFVPHAQIKVLELMPHAAAVQLVKEKKQRLLTLPRMRRDHPPTQLIRAANGDYLRGRLLAMDTEQLQVELGLEARSLPRSSVARIIWLHADELDPEASPPPPADPLPGVRVQAIPASGNRLTFFATECSEGKVLLGQSPVLGNCRVELETIDELLVGTAIERAAANLAFHQWRLKPAIDPLEFQESSDGRPGGVEGLESVLVGKPAPEIDLELLDGQRFRLADEREKVLVLDFWASWCGPCLQVMPQVDEVVREFADQQVELVAVNLQESPEQIKSALERLGLETRVALDRDGRVAERYGATAIPQTVIIDRDGKVARLFVGGGPRFGEKLRQAIGEVLGGGDERASAQP